MEGLSILAPGLMLDRYELICPIAQGGMASVWIARQTGKHGFERLVAIKTILPKYAAEASFQTMFLDEARITSRIEHNNVARVLDVGEQRGVTYLVIEYVDGDALSTINRLLKKRGATWPTAVIMRVMADVCGGLHAAHELRGAEGQLLGVVHRDVSPHNILIGTGGDAKLIDFGIAKARDRLSGDTSTGTLKGKVRYMAPEQARGAEADRRADIWAIGAMFYEVLAGKPPFERENEVQTLLALTSGVPPVPLPPTVPDAVARVVLRALEANPENRFETAAAMQRAIEEAMVTTHLVAGTTAVAAFLDAHLAERAKARKEAARRGLKAAAERESLRPSIPTSVLGPPSWAEDSAKPRGASRSSGASIPTPPDRSSGSVGSAAVGLAPRLTGRGRPVLVSAVIVASLVAAATGVTALRLSAAHPAAASLRPPTPSSALAPAPVATAAEKSGRDEESGAVPQPPAEATAESSPKPPAEAIAEGSPTSPAPPAMAAPLQGASASASFGVAPTTGGSGPEAPVTARPTASVRASAPQGAATTTVSRARRPRVDDGF
jgi:serine/threonine-protein kinase